MEFDLKERVSSCEDGDILTSAHVQHSHRVSVTSHCFANIQRGTHSCVPIYYATNELQMTSEIFSVVLFYYSPRSIPVKMFPSNFLQNTLFSRKMFLLGSEQSYCLQIFLLNYHLILHIILQYVIMEILFCGTPLDTSNFKILSNSSIYFRSYNFRIGLRFQNQASPDRSTQLISIVNCRLAFLFHF